MRLLFYKMDAKINGQNSMDKIFVQSFHEILIHFKGKIKILTVETRP